MTAVLVTGGAGYIGSHTCKQLKKEGYTPVVFDNLSEGHRWAVRYGPLVEGELHDTALVRDTLLRTKAEAVIHFAASAYVGESMREPQKYFHNNVGGTMSLLEAMREAQVRRLVFSSTCATYGLPETVPISEEHPQNPVNPYGESKLFVERMLHWYAVAHDFQYVALRYFNAAGADPDGEIGEDHDPETHLIPLAIQAAVDPAKRLQLFGTDYPTSDGTAIRDYVHVADLADAHVAAVRRLAEGHSIGVFNLGTGRGVSVREVIAAVEAVSGSPVKADEVARRPGDPPALVANPGKAEAELGWRAQHSDIRTIIESAWRWYNRSPNMT